MHGYINDLSNPMYAKPVTYKVQQTREVCLLIYQSCKFSFSITVRVFFFFAFWRTKLMEFNTQINFSPKIILKNVVPTLNTQCQDREMNTDASRS